MTYRIDIARKHLKRALWELTVQREIDDEVLAVKSRAGHSDYVREIRRSNVNQYISQIDAMIEDLKARP